MHCFGLGSSRTWFWSHCWSDPSPTRPVTNRRLRDGVECGRRPCAGPNLGRSRTLSRRVSWARGVRLLPISPLRHFVTPGLPGSAPPLLAQHDWVHVVADYGTTLESELDVFGLIARADDDPRGFSLLAMVIGLFETGLVTSGAGLFEADTGHLSEAGMATLQQTFSASTGSPTLIFRSSKSANDSSSHPSQQGRLLPEPLEPGMRRGFPTTSMSTGTCRF